jgi:hypothetical protein
MSVIAAALKHMLDGGMSREAMIAAVAEMEAEMRAAAANDPVAEKRRAYDRARKAAKAAERKSGGNPVEITEIQDSPLSLSPNENNSNPHTHTPEHKPRARKGGFVLPDKIPEAEWAAYVEMRQRIRKPMTDHAKGLAVAELFKLAEAGWPPGDVLNHSTMNSYQGLFPPKDRKNDRSPQRGENHRNGSGGKADGFTAALREAGAILGDRGTDDPRRSTRFAGMG